MASVNIKKFNKLSFFSMGSKHIDLKNREKLNHSNENINKNLITDNYFFGCDNWQQIVSKTNERIERVDKINPPKKLKKDRIIACGCEVPVPDEIRKMGSSAPDNFLEDVYNLLSAKLGKANMLGMAVHKDEQHEYIDAKTNEKKMSLIHGHIFFTPCVYDEIDGRKTPRINAKEKITRQFLIDINKDINEMCINRYGVKFMTGDYKKGQSRSIDELKTKSLKLQIKELNKKKHTAKDKLDLINQESIELNKENKKIERRKNYATKELEKVIDELHNAKLTLDQIKELDLDLFYSEFITIIEQMPITKQKEKELKEKVNRIPIFKEKLETIQGQMTIFNFMPNENNNDIR